MIRTLILTFLCLTTIPTPMQAAPNLPADLHPTVEVLIPGGEFLMGMPDGKDGLTQHTVRVDAFHMDQHEVTNAQYLIFCETTDRKLPIFWDLDRFRSGPDFPNHPVVGVSNSDAKAYAQWIGRRLPTEAEWEFAARGGLEGKKYDTGDDLPDSTANTKSAKLGGPVAAASFRPNAYGLHDMVGNVREWVSDYYTNDSPGGDLQVNPTGPAKGRQRVIKGGGWFSGTSCNRVHVRNALAGGWGDFNVGFRCARDAQKTND